MLSWLDYRTWRQASPHGSVQVIPRGWVVERLGSGKRDGGAKITSASPKLKKLSFTQRGYGVYFRN
ncbi:MAG: hypothetical protein BRC55_03065 [Cyanobacteria bacterium SW_8_48_13]|jgi:hypothetical protein|nr:MAG: hypothetical protein BRC55_03065 [Cyanobacteria bacterium SW_8_48_13]